MKLIARIMILCCVFFVLLLAYGFYEARREDSYLAGAEGPRIKNPEGVTFVVIGNNSSDAEKHEVLRQSAIKYILKVSDATEEVRAMERLPVGPDLPAQSRKMTALAAEGDIYGTAFDSLGHCGAAGRAANLFWTARRTGSVGSLSPQQAYEGVNEAAEACRKQIAKKLELTVTLNGPVEQVKPPFPGCLTILDFEEKPTFSQWTCPSAAVSS